MELSAKVLESARTTSAAQLGAIDGLSRRGDLHRDIEHSLADADGSGLQVALLLLDLDDLKFVNDNLGYKMGDGLLSAISNRLASVAGSEGRAYRIGGDEFVVLHVGLPGRSEPVQLATSVVASVRRPFDLTELPPDAAVLAGDHITCSLGVTLGRPGDTSNAILERADGAMFVAKDKHGRRPHPGDRYVVFEELSASDIPTHLRGSAEDQ